MAFKHSNGIKVFEEKYDEESNGAQTRIIFKKDRSSEQNRDKKKIDKKTGKNTTDLIDRMMKLAIRKFPYERERKRDRKN